MSFYEIRNKTEDRLLGSEAGGKNPFDRAYKRAQRAARETLDEIVVIVLLSDSSQPMELWSSYDRRN